MLCSSQSISFNRYRALNRGVRHLHYTPRFRFTCMLLKLTWLRRRIRRWCERTCMALCDYSGYARFARKLFCYGFLAWHRFNNSRDFKIEFTLRQIMAVDRAVLLVQWQLRENELYLRSLIELRYRFSCNCYTEIGACSNLMLIYLERNENDKVLAYVAMIRFV